MVGIIEFLGTMELSWPEFATAAGKLLSAYRIKRVEHWIRILRQNGEKWEVSPFANTETGIALIERVFDDVLQTASEAKIEHLQIWLSHRGLTRDRRKSCSMKASFFQTRSSHSPNRTFPF